MLNTIQKSKNMFVFQTVVSVFGILIGCLCFFNAIALKDVVADLTVISEFIFGASFMFLSVMFFVVNYREFSHYKTRFVDGTSDDSNVFRHDKYTYTQRKIGFVTGAVLFGLAFVQLVFSFVYDSPDYSYGLIGINIGFTLALTLFAFLMAYKFHMRISCYKQIKELKELKPESYERFLEEVKNV